MQVIPVIDVKNGIVVQARGGNRANYQPLQSTIVKGYSVEDVAQALLEVTNTNTLYIADLDAIEHRNSNRSKIDKLADRIPNLQLLLDEGTTAPTSNHRAPNIVSVIGTETLGGAPIPQGDFILSLDHHSGKRLGPSEIFENARLWPKQVIIMTLDRVGASAGPNIDLLNHYRRLSNQHDFYAAGGVQSSDDLLQLCTAGAAGALVASALHDGRLSSQQIKQLQKD